ncbi:MAG: hypothetical protein KKC46_19715 [Proteobacteria bacterium]|nr:hypothetical protein [Pseudomonadota bacterium]
MIKQLSYIWRKLGSIHLTVVLCLLLTADLTYGYISINRRTNLFASLNDIGLTAWIETYGRHNLLYTAWFFILLGLLTLLCINTFACTTDRVILLIRSREHFGIQRFLFKFSPHIMHYAMIILLVGYLFSYISAQVIVSQTMVPGTTITLPGKTAQITFESFEPVYYHGDRLAFLNNYVISPRAKLLLTDGDYNKTAVLSYNQPVWFKGYGIFLKNFAPRKKDGMAIRVRIDMNIRKDPGVCVYIAGIILFTAGLFMYLAEWIFFKKYTKESL